MPRYGGWPAGFKFNRNAIKKFIPKTIHPGRWTKALKRNNGIIEDSRSSEKEKVRARRKIAFFNRLLAIPRNPRGRPKIIITKTVVSKRSRKSIPSPSLNTVKRKLSF